MALKRRNIYNVDPTLLTWGSMVISERHIDKINWILAGCLGVVILITLLFVMIRPGKVVLPELLQKRAVTLPHSFALKEEAYQKINGPWLSLAFKAPTLQLPDLRNHLSFYGMNGRPDAPKEAPLLHFGLVGAKKIKPVWANDKLYLDYDKFSNPPAYVFSKDNRETPLWIEAVSGENEAIVSVSMVDEKGEMILGDAQIREFKLPAKEWTRPAGPQNGREQWELGKHRVDGTLLARQHAKWHGKDCFLEKHGGSEFSFTVNKHRIDFGEGENLYSVFVELGDCLIWDEGRWNEVAPGIESLGKPLLYVKKVDERLMSFELWEESGQRKVPLTLLKANEVWSKDSLQKDFRFIGARTRSQCVFEVGQERMLLQPFDWLILTDSGWRKLETEEEIDGYVERKITGPLFVFDGMVKKDEHQVLLGTLYNASRTDSESMELAVHHGGVTIIPQEVVPLDETTEYSHAFNY